MRLLPAFLLLAACNSVPASQQYVINTAPRPDFAAADQRCSEKYLGKSNNSGLLQFNECERVAMIESFGILGVDLINATFNQKSYVYKQLLAQKITAKEASDHINQIEDDFRNATKERVALMSASTSQIVPSYSEPTRNNRIQEQPVSYGNKVYNADECIGAVVMGVCHGSVIDAGTYHKTCHGEMLNGECTGPMF